MVVTVVVFVDGMVGNFILVRLSNRLVELKIRRIFKTVQTIRLLRSVRILIRNLDTRRDLLSLRHI